MNPRSRLVQRLIIGLLLASFFGVALYLRISLPYNQVFGGEITKFTGVDAYWHMRFIDHLVHNFPHLISFDPYMLYPTGAGTSSAFPFFDYLIAGFIWIVGLGSPSQNMIDVIAAYFPAVLGALTIIPAFFIGKSLFSPWAGVVAAGLVAIFPGEFLGRSILGFTDHHVAEVFLSTVAMAFLVAAIKSGREKELSFAHMRQIDKDRLKKPLVLSAFAGLFLGLYLITWQGSLLFIFVLGAYLVIQAVVDHLRREPTQYLSIVLGVTFLLALIISVSVSRYTQYAASLTLAFAAAIILPVVSGFMHRRQLNAFFFPLTLMILGGAGFGILYAADSSLATSMLGRLDIFSWPTGTTVLEMQPLFLPGGEFSFSVVWGNFNMSCITGIVALGMLIYFLIRKNEPHRMLFVVWTLVILAVTLAQRRFNYYLAVNVALLSGFFCWEVLHLVGLGKEEAAPVRPPVTPTRKKKRKQKAKKAARGWGVPARYVYIAMASLILFFAVYFPNIGPARSTAGQARFAPSDAWCETLAWLRESTPEPFCNPDFYYSTYARPFEYPETAYGVTAWWDYGYWIIRIGHRIPSQNPGGAIPKVASVFVKQDEASASQIMEELGSKYFVIDYDMVTSKFHAPATISGGRPEDYFDVFYEKDEEKQLYVGKLFYFPEYYRSLCVRLYNFAGQAVLPGRSTVITWEWFSQEGTAYKRIVDRKDFESYQAAAQYAAQQGSDRCLVVGDDPFSSPIPLEELTQYKLVYNSSNIPNQYGVPLPAVRVFEYSG